MIHGVSVRNCEINFLCIHKKLRAKRLAPVLIKEVTRRVNLVGIFQAAYTAGVVLPKPVASCRYWHRSLQPKKLIEVGFSRLAPRMTMARTQKLYALPDVSGGFATYWLLPRRWSMVHARPTRPFLTFTGFSPLCSRPAESQDPGPGAHATASRGISVRPVERIPQENHAYAP